MKISVIVPTNEVRRPVEGEYCWNNEANSGKGMWQSCVYGALNGTYLVGKAHEVEVPDDATEFRYLFRKGHISETSFDIIPLPRKKKVKKWQWLVRFASGQYGVTTEHYADEPSVERLFAVTKVLYIIPETEIEVDE